MRLNASMLRSRPTLRRGAKAPQAPSAENPYRRSCGLLPTWIIDRETLAFLAVNDAAVAHYGYSREEFLTMTARDIRPAEDVSALLDHLAEQERNPLPALGSSGVWRHRRKDGTLRDEQVHWSPISFEGREAYLVLAQDVTERLRAEEHLRERERELSDFVEQAPVALRRVGSDGTILWANQAELDLLGYAREEYIGQPIADFHVDRAVLDDLLHRLKRGETLRDFEARLRCKDGSIRHVAISSNVLWEDGRFLHSRCFTTDITERKRAEEKTRLLQSITLAVSEADDFRSALGVAMTRACQATGWALAEAWVPRSDGSCLEWWASSQVDRAVARFPRRAEALTLAPGEGLPGRAWASKSPLWVRDLRTDTSFRRAPWVRQAGLKAALAVPVLAGDEVVAIIDFFLTELREEDERFVGVVQAIASQLGWLIWRRRSEEERRQLLERERSARAEAEAALERLRSIHGVTDAALARLAMDDLLREMLARLRVILSADTAFVFLLSEDGAFLSVRAAHGLEEAQTKGWRVPMGEGIAGAIAARREPMIVADLSKVAKVRRGFRDRVKSLMGVPLLVEGQVVGVLQVGTSRARRFSEQDLGLLQLVAHRVAPTIDRMRLLEEARRGRERLSAMSRRLVDLQEAERRRIARELHDEVGQLLTILGLALDSTGRSLADGSEPGRRWKGGLGDLDRLKRRRARRPALQPQALRRQIEEMRDLVTDLLARVRNLSLNLRPPMLDDLGLLPALLWHFQRYTTQTRVRVDFRHGGLGRRFSGVVETAAFRIAQEALTNVARHAGVDKVKVQVSVNGARLGIRIEDQGRGFDADAVLTRPSTGLAGMAERADLLGGQLIIDSAPRKGTRLSAELPLGGNAKKRVEH